MSPERRRRQRGQTIMLMIAAVSLALLVLAMTIDGGHAFAQQRVAQNGADAASLAGGVALSNYVACYGFIGLASACTTPSGGWDDTIRARIDEKAAESGVTVTLAVYTDVDGNAVSSVEIGNQGTGSPPATARGVEVRVNRVAATFVASIVGVSSFSLNTQAQAIAGWINGDCVITAASISGCALLPIAVPMTIVTCDGQNRAIISETPWPINDDPNQTHISIPLCGSDPGNVGWVMWEGQGADTLINSVWNAREVDITIPSWQGVKTGNLSPQDLEAALRSYAGEVIMAPRFDFICGSNNNDPPNSSVPTINDPEQWYGCPAADFGGGNGQNMWYRFPGIYYFEMCEPSLAWCNGKHAAYVNGSNTECDVGGNGATRCIIGRFRTGIGFGAGGSATEALVQLVR